MVVQANSMRRCKRRHTRRQSDRFFCCATHMRFTYRLGVVFQDRKIFHFQSINGPTWAGSSRIPEAADYSPPARSAAKRKKAHPDRRTFDHRSRGRTYSAASCWASLLAAAFAFAATSRCSSLSRFARTLVASVIRADFPRRSRR